MAGDMTLITVAEFNQLTASLIGQPLSQVSTSYGDILDLDFGKLNPYKHPKLANLKKGDWILSVVMSNSTDNVDSLVGKIIGSISLRADLELTVRFDNLVEFTVTPDYKEAEELAYWELWLPTEQFIKASVKGLELKSN